MTTTEFYYLLLVLGAFGAFAVGISLAMVQYTIWVRRQAVAPITAGRTPGKDDRPQQARRFADAA